MNVITQHPPREHKIFRAAWGRVCNFTTAQTVWDLMFSNEDREFYEDDLFFAFKTRGVPGMWSTLRGIPKYRAVLDIAVRLGYVVQDEYRYALQKFGEPIDGDEAWEAAIVKGHMVLNDRDREAHFEGKTIDVDWYQKSESWDFLWEISWRAKGGHPIDSTAFPRSKDSNVITKRKNRLKGIPKFPKSIINAIRRVGTGTQQLMLPRPEIRLFRVSALDTLEEWTP